MTAEELHALITAPPNLERATGRDVVRHASIRLSWDHDKCEWVPEVPTAATYYIERKSQEKHQRAVAG